MGVLGRETAGATTFAMDGGVFVLSCPVVDLSGQQATKISFYASVSTSAHKLTGVIYRMSDGVLLAQTLEVDVPVQAAGWIDLEFDEPFLLSNLAYAIGVFAETETGDILCYYDAWNENYSTYYKTGFSYPTIPDPATDFSYATEDLSCNLTYEAVPAGENLTGTYKTPVRDLGYIAVFKIGIETVVVVSNDMELDDSETLELDDSDTLRLSGGEVVGAVSFKIKTSEDNVTWSDWIAWQPADYVCRYFQIEMTITRETVSTVLLVSQFDYYADLPDVDEFGTGEVSNPSTPDVGVDITFIKTFHVDPSVNVSILTGDGFVHKLTNLSTTGVTVTLYDLSGVAKTGTFSYHVHGI
jgi:hypothetical protein